MCSKINTNVLFPQRWFNKTFAACVLDPNDFECQYDPEDTLLVEQQLTYFCGSAPECLQVGNKRALQQAKANLEKYYSVVGLASDLQLSLLVFEQYLPRFFSGAKEIFKQMTSENGAEYKRNQSGKDDLGKRKAVLKLGRTTLQAEAVLKRNLSLEIDFFAFATRRLMIQGRYLRTTAKGDLLSKILRKHEE